MNKINLLHFILDSLSLKSDVTPHLAANFSLYPYVVQGVGDGLGAAL